MRPEWLTVCERVWGVAFQFKNGNYVSKIIPVCSALIFVCFFFLYSPVSQEVWIEVRKEAVGDSECID